ncbi:MAG: hypothetical protein IBX70_01705 [Clostridia bacterium]|nr:hypothetical protein [Clostridia bacterium]
MNKLDLDAFTGYKFLSGMNFSPVMIRNSEGELLDKEAKKKFLEMLREDQDYEFDVVDGKSFMNAMRGNSLGEI